MASTRKIDKIFIDREVLLADISDEWLALLDTPKLSSIFNLIGDFKNVTPPINKIFEFARLTELSKIKVVILGQDVYPRAGDAHGLAFSCLTNIPASLRNIYKCLINNKSISDMPESGDLSYWAEQGVLLLNCALTTVIGNSNAHAAYWSDYTNELISKIYNNNCIVFMLWGNFAKEKRQYIESIKSNKIHILEWSHPSPLAQHRQPFIDCDHFGLANKILTTYKLEPIDWHQTPPLNEVDSEFFMNNKKQVAFTDGSANPNKTCPAAIAGYAAAFVLGTMKDVILYGNIQNRPHFANNQRAEGMAIYKVMLYLKDRLQEWNECIIVSDSNFWITMFEKYMPYWEKNNINFNEKKNPDLTIDMYNIYKELTMEFGKTIEFRHIKSHGKDNWQLEDSASYKYFCYHQNAYVDTLASYARKKLSPGEDIIATIEYES
jgi:uracil-DNA glycosylase